MSMNAAEALRSYGRHNDTCAGRYNYTDMANCNCGLAGTIAALEGDARQHDALLADKTKLEEAMSVMVAAQHKLERQIVKTRAAIQRALDYLNGKDD